MYTRDMFLNELFGIKDIVGTFDFLYVQCGHACDNVGHFYVNLVSMDTMQTFSQHLSGHLWKHAPEHQGQVVVDYSDEFTDKRSVLQHYRRSMVRTKRFQAYPEQQIFSWSRLRGCRPVEIGFSEQFGSLVEGLLCAGGVR
jgi:hypothetical protein